MHTCSRSSTSAVPSKVLRALCASAPPPHRHPRNASCISAPGEAARKRGREREREESGEPEATRTAPRPTARRTERDRGSEREGSCVARAGQLNRKCALFYNCLLGNSVLAAARSCILAADCITVIGSILAAAISWHLFARPCRLCVQPAFRKVSACTFVFYIIVVRVSPLLCELFSF